MALLRPGGACQCTYRAPVVLVASGGRRARQRSGGAHSANFGFEAAAAAAAGHAASATTGRPSPRGWRRYRRPRRPRCRRTARSAWKRPLPTPRRSRARQCALGGWSAAAAATSGWSMRAEEPAVFEAKPRGAGTRAHCVREAADRRRHSHLALRRRRPAGCTHATGCGSSGAGRCAPTCRGRPAAAAQPGCARWARAPNIARSRRRPRAAPPPRPSRSSAADPPPPPRRPARRRRAPRHRGRRRVNRRPLKKVASAA